MAKNKNKNKNNVVIFPNMRRGMPTTIDEIKQNLVIEKVEIAEFLAEELTKEITRLMDDNGYQITNISDLAFLMITIKAILLRKSGIYHPAQSFIDDNIKISDGVVLPGMEEVEEEKIDI